MALQLWPGESALVKRIAHPSDRAWQEVIGVVRDISFPTNLNVPRTPFQTYRLLAREPTSRMSLLMELTSTTHRQTPLLTSMPFPVGAPAN